MRAAITACTVGGKSAGGSGPVSAERPVPACISIPVVSMMKNGFPPACCAIRWAVDSSRPSPASRASWVESSSESVSRYRFTEFPRPPPQSGRSSSSAYRAAHTTSSGMSSASRTISSTRSSIGAWAAWMSSSTTTTVPRLENPRRSASSARTDLGHAIALLVPGLPADPERDAQALDDLPSLIGRVALDDDLLQSCPQRVRRSVRRLPHLVQEDLGERPEGHVLLERTRPAPQDLRLVGQSRDELVGDPALADPRLAEQRHQVSAARLPRAIERVLQQPQLALAVDERDRPAARARLQRGDRPRARLVLEPLGLDLAHRPVLDLRQRQEVARLRDQHGSRVRGLLQTGRQVHRGAVEQALLGRLGADRDRARVDADADPERDREPDLLAEATDAIDEPQAGPDGAERVVVVRVLQAEDPNDRVPGEVVRAAAERFELLGDHAVVAGEDLACSARDRSGWRVVSTPRGRRRSP